MILISESPVILILSILIYRLELFVPEGYFGLYPARLPTYINCHPKGFWGRRFTGRMPFMLPNH